MTYDPQTYWTQAGTDPVHIDHESRFVRTDVFAHQEERLMATLERLEFESVLEFGCGWGRITKLVHDRWPATRYEAVDLSQARLDSARGRIGLPPVWFRRTTIADYGTYDRPVADLVLAVETLMHVPPADIEAAVAKLLSLSSRYVVSVDWSEPIDGPIAPWNTRHDYERLYGNRLVSSEKIGLQSIYVAQ